MRREKEKNKEKEKNSQHNENSSVSDNQETSMHNEADNTNELAEKRIAELEQELNDYKDKVLRKAAEFENYKRRTENDQVNLFKYAAESFIIKLLPVIDDFERSLQHIDTSKDIDAVKQGIHLVYEKFKKLLIEQGVTRIESVGQPFDVHYHEAVMQRTDDDSEPYTVLDEIETGYLYKDRVIRHSKVIVSDDSSGKNLNQED
jgi:molecular chaperone GrpE